MFKDYLLMGVISFLIAVLWNIAFIRSGAKKGELRRWFLIPPIAIVVVLFWAIIPPLFLAICGLFLCVDGLYWLDKNAKELWKEISAATTHQIYLMSGRLEAELILNVKKYIGLEFKHLDVANYVYWDRVGCIGRGSHQGLVDKYYPQIWDVMSLEWEPLTDDEYTDLKYYRGPYNVLFRIAKTAKENYQYGPLLDDRLKRERSEARDKRRHDRLEKARDFCARVKAGVNSPSLEEA